VANIRTVRRSGRVFRGGRSRRESLWLFGGPFDTTLAVATSSALVGVLNAGALALRPFTVVRTHLNWFMKSDQTGVLEEQQVGYGLAVVSDQASAIGITAVPTPFTDLGSDLWFLHAVLASSFTFISGVGVEAPGGTMKDVDSRAMRKVEDGQDIAVVLENSGISDGTQNLSVFRMLVKLH